MRKSKLFGCRFAVLALSANWAAATAGPPVGGRPASSTQLIVKEELKPLARCHIQAGDKRRKSVFTPDYMHEAVIVERAGQQVVIFDGKDGPAHDVAKADWQLPRIILSGDGKRCAYVAKNGSEVYAVVDQVEYGPYSNVNELIFSPDSTAFAYGANVKTASGWDSALFIDGKVFWQGTANGLQFSPDSKRISWDVALGGHLFVGDIGSGEWRSIPKDAAREMAIKRDPREQLAVDRSISLSISPQSLCFSPDSRRWAAVARSGGKIGVLLNGKPVGPYLGVGAYRGALGGGGWNCTERLVFSPNGKRLAYGVMKLNEKFVVIDEGKEGIEYDRLVADPTFSPDSRRIGYVAGRKKAGTDEYDVFVVVDGKEILCTWAKSLTFSPDSQHFAFWEHVENLPNPLGPSYFINIDGTRSTNSVDAADIFDPPTMDRQEPVLVFDSPTYLHGVGMSKTKELVRLDVELAATAAPPPTKRPARKPR